MTGLRHETTMIEATLAEARQQVTKESLERLRSRLPTVTTRHVESGGLRASSWCEFVLSLADELHQVLIQLAAYRNWFLVEQFTEKIANIDWPFVSRGLDAELDWLAKPNIDILLPADPSMTGEETTGNRNISTSETVSAKAVNLSRIDDERLPVHIKAGDHAQITVVGQVHNTHGEIKIGNRDSGALPNGSRFSTFASWPFFSAVCGIGAVVLAIIIGLLPTNEWRAIVGGLIGLGLLVTTFVMSMNPVNFYRRMLNYVIPSGMLVNALGFSLDAFVSHETTKGWLRWDSSVSGWFFFAWAAVIGFLVWGDSKQRR